MGDDYELNESKLEEEETKKMKNKKNMISTKNTIGWI